MPETDRPVFGGRYELYNRLARGGMSEVFLGRDRVLDRPIAVKVLFREFATDDSFVERFRREAQAAAALSHTNVVSVYDWGEQDGTQYIVMEYADGLNLAEIIRSEGPLDPNRSADIAIAIAASLAFAHTNEMIHRDIKPGNVLTTTEGRVKVADFGIARALTGRNPDLTQTGSVMGTATYLSPEQSKGYEADQRSDIYSLAVVLYEMLTAGPPFTGDNAVAIAYKHVSEEPRPPRHFNNNIPAALEAICLHGLKKDPHLRYGSAEEILSDLQSFRAGLGAPIAEAARDNTSAAAGAAGAPDVASAAGTPDVAGAASAGGGAGGGAGTGGGAGGGAGTGGYNNAATDAGGYNNPASGAMPHAAGAAQPAPQAPQSPPRQPQQQAPQQPTLGTPPPSQQPAPQQAPPSATPTQPPSATPTQPTSQPSPPQQPPQHGTPPQQPAPQQAPPSATPTQPPSATPTQPPSATPTQPTSQPSPPQQPQQHTPPHGMQPQQFPPSTPGAPTPDNAGTGMPAAAPNATGGGRPSDAHGASGYDDRYGGGTGGGGTGGGYNDRNGDGEDLPPNDAPDRTPIWIAVLVVLLIVIVGLVFLLVSSINQDDEATSDNTDPTSVVQLRVPQLVGLNWEEAEGLLQDQGFEYIVIEFEDRDDIDKNLVFQQNPRAGILINPTETSANPVEMFVSDGPNTVRVPEVANRQFIEAEQLLISAGFTVERIDIRSDEVDAGLVIEQSVPSTQERPQGTTITLTVSAGRGEVAVPNVEGQTFTDARVALARAGLVERVERAFSTLVPLDSVISTDPAPGTGLARGAIVTLLVSDGPEELVVPIIAALGTIDDPQQIVTSLQSLGFSARIHDVSPDQAAGQPREVIGLDPAPGTTLLAGSEVLVLVGIEDGNTLVPTLSTLGTTDPDEVEAKLLELGFSTVRAERDVSVNSSDVGRVIALDPPPGTRVFVESQVISVIVGVAAFG